VNITRPCAQSPVAGSETWSRGYGAEDRRHRAEQGGVGRTFAYGVWNSVAGLTQVSGFPFQVFPSVVSGLDLSETIHGAGGVGGLLMWLQPQSVGWSSELELRPHWYTYDGNGNVSDLVSGDWDFTTFLDPAFSSALENHYEYGPFGGIVAATENRPENPFKFSTKWHEGNRLVYYGYRFYNPETGRWVSRDPIGERGGVNLNGFIGNGPTNSTDMLGLFLMGRMRACARIPSSLAKCSAGLGAISGNPGAYGAQCKKAYEFITTDAAGIPSEYAAAVETERAEILESVANGHTVWNYWASSWGGTIETAAQARAGRDLQTKYSREIKAIEDCSCIASCGKLADDLRKCLAY